MATEKPVFPNKPTPSKSYDSLLEPLPLPEVEESDSDTAWGRWEDSLQSFEETPAAPATIPSPLEPDFDVTVPMDLENIPGLTDPSKR
jgi:hypothetical protein